MVTKLKLRGSSNKNGIYIYKLYKIPNMHRFICNFLNELDFSEESILEFDQNIENLSNEVLSTKSGNKIAYLFITDDTVFLVLEPHTNLIMEIAKRYFEL